VGGIRSLDEAMEDNLDAEQALAAAQSISILDPLRVPWSFETRRGQPATEIMRSAKGHGAEIIVVARRRHGAVGSLTYFSISAQLLHRWPHTLLVVHPPPGGSASAATDTITMR
jgi:nucleotide-binding universal stress UspA family protein